MPNRLAAIPKPSRDSSPLWIVADQQTAIAFRVLVDRGHPVCRLFGTRDATIMCDDLMSTHHERCRVIGANIVAHEKQDFHLGSSAWTDIFDFAAHRRGSKLDYSVFNPNTAAESILSSASIIWRCPS